MGINTTKSLTGKPDSAESDAAKPSDSGRKGEPEMRGKRVMSDDQPSTTIKASDDDKNSAADQNLQGKTREYIESQDKVEVYIPRARGLQTVQINGTNFTVPAGQKVEVPADIASALKRSGVLRRDEDMLTF